MAQTKFDKFSHLTNQAMRNSIPIYWPTDVQLKNLGVPKLTILGTVQTEWMGTSFPVGMPILQ